MDSGPGTFQDDIESFGEEASPDAPLTAGTDYAGPQPDRPESDPVPGAVGEDVIVIAAEEATAYGDSPAQPAATGTAAGGADQWSEIKAMFVDDPSASVRLASGLVERAIEGLMTSVRQRQDSLALSWQDGDATGTEELRNALRGYRGLFEEIGQLSGQFPAGQDRVAGRS